MTASDPSCPTVLVVEDDPKVGPTLVQYLQAHQLDAALATTLSCARTVMRQRHVDAVLLDLTLDDEDGLSLGRELARGGGPPFLVLSARGSEADRVIGLDAGADDYMVKPISYRELLARVRGVIRRATAGPASLPRRRVAHVDAWTIDLSGLRGRHAGGREASFTSGEMALLRALLARPMVTLSRAALLTATAHEYGTVLARTVDVLMTRLRRKLDLDPSRPSLVRTVRGEGYRLDVEVTWELLDH